MSLPIIKGPITIHPSLYQVVEQDILPQSGITSDQFWTSLGNIIVDFSPENEALLRTRDALQARIDAFLLTRRGKQWDQALYTAKLAEMGYLVPRDETPFKVEHTTPLDPEVTSMPGPQLVVPVDNIRYALNAANARWGNLLDAFYGTDAGPSEADGCEKGSKYNPKRGGKVFDMCHQFLDEFFPLAGGNKYKDVVHFSIDTSSPTSSRLVIKTNKNGITYLDQDSQFQGHVLGKTGQLSNIILRHNALAVELEMNRDSEIGKSHPAGLSAVYLESAVTAICDFEDSVAAVDAQDKAKVYKNWNDLMRGIAQERLTATSIRRLREDRVIINRQGKNETLKGRALLFVRNVGIHMYTDMVKMTTTGAKVPEGIVDAMVSALAARHDMVPTNKSKSLLNSAHGNMYLVKPKMHGPAEVAFVVRLVTRVEKELGLRHESIKLGIMDEERRTTVNLKECIRAARTRCVFINTGFLDRTGDEIHTSFAYGPMLPKKEIESATWRLSYEDWNVDIGLEVDLPRSGQIGKGMWAAPDAMAEMLKKKGAHPQSGATTAWVPSPTAATLHAIHYHRHSVVDAQQRIRNMGLHRAKLSDILTPPFLNRTLTKAEIMAELENNAQGMLGYVSRWIMLGIGCSKVPDLHDVGLMEDRATLRISSQHIANWLEHGLVTEEQVISAFEKMARIVDRQNHGTGGYQPMSNDFKNSRGFQAALEMVWRGKQEANGLTERTLTEFRRAEKAANMKGRL
jgi:malate synthase